MVCFPLEPATSHLSLTQGEKVTKENEASITCRGGLESQPNQNSVSIKKHFLLGYSQGPFLEGVTLKYGATAVKKRKGLRG